MSEELREHVMAIIEEQIRADLTQGREDNDLEPMTPNQIVAFIDDNRGGIILATDEIIDEYRQDNSLNDLYDSPHVRVREYMYNYINTFAQLN